MANDPNILSIDYEFADPRVTSAAFAGAETALGDHLGRSEGDDVVRRSVEFLSI